MRRLHGNKISELMRRYNLVSLAAVAAATAFIVYLIEPDVRSILVAVGIAVSLAWNISNTNETKNMEKTIRERDITFREFNNIVASPLREMLRQLMDSGDNLATLFEIENQQDKARQVGEMNKKISRQLYALQSECMRIDALENEDFGDEWSEPTFELEGEILLSFEKFATAADEDNEDEFFEGVSNVQMWLATLNASMQHKIYERFQEIG